MAPTRPMTISATRGKPSKSRWSEEVDDVEERAGEVVREWMEEEVLVKCKE